jgi:hypothetical protein
MLGNSKKAIAPSGTTNAARCKAICKRFFMGDFPLLLELQKTNQT